MKIDQNNSAFTLIEILLIVSILGILAALVVPEFGSATVKGKNAALLSNLQMMRKQISLYQVHHGGFLPGQRGNATWQEALLKCTDENGDLYTSEMEAASVKRRGPYLDEVPVNVFNGLNTVRFDGADAGADSHGWRFDTVTGEFTADDNFKNENGIAHSQL